MNVNKWIDPFLEKEASSCTDNTDKSNNEEGLSVLSGFFYAPSYQRLNDTEIIDDYEERLAIAEHDGLQNSGQAERIAMWMHLFRFW